MHPSTGHPAASELLAKPPKGTRKGRSVVEHTRDVVEAFGALFCDADRPELVENWLRFFRLKDKEAFLINGLAAAACHDWGKANDGFQAMLFRKGRQLLRHERVRRSVDESPQCLELALWEPSSGLAHCARGGGGSSPEDQAERIPSCGGRGLAPSFGSTGRMNRSSSIWLARWLEFWA